MHRPWIAFGAIAGLAGVFVAAWGAHGAGTADPAVARAVGAAQAMLVLHAPALLATGLWAARRGGRLPQLAGAAFAVGTALFTGAVLAGALGRALGPVAPIGGTLLIAGWVLLLLSALRR